MIITGIGSPITVTIIPPEQWVQQTRGLAPSDPSTLRGFVDYATKQIYIEDTEMSGSTLLHELLHITSDFCGANLSEEQVEATERGLWAVLGQNPHLLEYWKDTA